MIKVTVWNEYVGDKQEGKFKETYPMGLHNAIAEFLCKDEEIEVKTATLEQPEHGLTEEVLDNTDVLIWWGHKAHTLVSDEITERVTKRVLQGMGFIALHSAHMAKPLIKLLGTSCTLKWREIGERERIWTVAPNHPIAKGVPEQFLIEREEMYGEFFDIPTPDELVFVGWFQGGEVFRSGCCWNRGYGKVFYFQPGHETYPNYYCPEIQKIITNAVHWAKSEKTTELDCPNIKETLEKIN